MNGGAQMVSLAVHRDGQFLHGFQERGLCFRRRAVDFVGEKQIRKNRAAMKHQRASLAAFVGLQNLRAGDVGLLGDSYVDITRGTTAYEPIADGGALKTAEKADIAVVMQNTNEVIMNLNALSMNCTKITTQIQSGKGSMGKLIYDQSLYNKMDATVSTAQSLVNSVQRGEGTLGKLMVDETLYNRTVATLNRLDQVIDEVQHGEGSLAKFISDPSAYNNLNRLMTNGNTLIDGINQGHGTLGKLVKDEQFYNHMNETLAHMDTITARIDQGQGTLGKLSTDSTLFDNLKESSQSLKEFLADFRKNPKKYLSIKLHIF